MLSDASATKKLATDPEGRAAHDVSDDWTKRARTQAAYELAFGRAQGEMLESRFVAQSEIAWASGDAALGHEDWVRVFRARTV